MYSFFCDVKCSGCRSPVAGRRSPVTSHDIWLSVTKWCSSLLHYLSSCCGPETSRAVRCRPITGDFLPIKAVRNCRSSLFSFEARSELSDRCWQSSPVAASCRRPRGFGSVQQTPVACRRYAIRRCTNLLCCYVRSWYVGTPIRRCTNLFVVLNVGIWSGDSPVAGRRYAASPVYQSVVLNVGIWYGDSPVAGTPLRRCTNLLCCTLESDTATRRSPVAGTPLRLCTHLLFGTRKSDTPICW